MLKCLVEHNQQMRNATLKTEEEEEGEEFIVRSLLAACQKFN